MSFGCAYLLWCGFSHHCDGVTRIRRRYERHNVANVNSLAYRIFMMRGVQMCKHGYSGTLLLMRERYTIPYPETYILSTNALTNCTILHHNCNSNTRLPQSHTRSYPLAFIFSHSVIEASNVCSLVSSLCFWKLARWINLWGELV